jgi:hypothetical protein
MAPSGNWTCCRTLPWFEWRIEEACKGHEDNWPAALEALDEALRK